MTRSTTQPRDCVIPLVTSKEKLQRSAYCMSLPCLFQILGLFTKSSIFPFPAVMSVLCNTFLWHWLTRSPPEDEPAKRPAPARVTGQSEGSRPTKISSDVYCFAHGTASLQFILCSPAPISWLHESMKAHPFTALFQWAVNSHSVAAYLHLGLEVITSGGTPLHPAERLISVSQRG